MGTSVPASNLTVDYYHGGCRSDNGTLYVSNGMFTLFEFENINHYAINPEFNKYFVRTRLTPGPDMDTFTDDFGNTNVCLDIRCPANIPCGIEAPFSMLIQPDDVDGTFVVGGVTATAEVVAETSLTFGNGLTVEVTANLCSGSTTVNLGESMCLEISHAGLPYYSIDFFSSFIFSQDGVDFTVILPGGVSAPTTTGPTCTNDVGTGTQTCVIETPLPFTSGPVTGLGEVVFIDNDTGDGIPPSNRRRLAETGEAKMKFSFEIVDPNTESSATYTGALFSALVGVAVVVASAI